MQGSRQTGPRLDDHRSLAQCFLDSIHIPEQVGRVEILSKQVRSCYSDDAPCGGIRIQSKLESGYSPSLRISGVTWKFFDLIQLARLLNSPACDICAPCVVRRGWGVKRLLHVWETVTIQPTHVSRDPRARSLGARRAAERAATMVSSHFEQCGDSVALVGLDSQYFAGTVVCSARSQPT